MCYSDAYIIVKGEIDNLVAAANESDKKKRFLAFKYNTPSRSCISKISNIVIDNAESIIS